MATTLPDTPKVTVTAKLAPGSVELLRQLASAQNVTLEEALQRAINTEGLIQKRIKDNSRVFLESSDGGVSELTFRYANK